MGYQWAIDMGYRYGIWDIDMGYGTSIWSSWISIWDILSRSTSALTAITAGPTSYLSSTHTGIPLSTMLPEVYGRKLKLRA